MKPPICPDCNTEMMAGFIPEITAGAASIQSVWIPGPPEPQKILGLRTGAVKVDGEAAMPIVAWRCASCAQIRLTAGK